MRAKDRYLNLLLWREHHIKEKNFVLFLSLLVGLLAGVAAFLLKYAILLIERTLTNHFPLERANYWYLVLPVVGIFISGWFVRHIVKDDIGHGVTKILYAISQHKAILKLHNVWSSLVGSAITIGFGGSVGAEAPAVLTGSAIGSNLGKMFKMNQKTLMLLVGCGAAGAISGIFKAPIAGVLFTLEVLMLDMTMASVVPLLISSVTATSLTFFLNDDQVMFHFNVTAPFVVSRIPFHILLGIVCGLVSLYMTRGMNALEGVFRRLNSPYKKLLLGGTILSFAIFFFPPLYGEGYESIRQLLTGNVNGVFEKSLFYDYRNQAWAIILYLSAIVIFKAFATSATNGGGGVGGVFAPSLFVGCITGYLLAFVLNHFFHLNIPIENFAFAGMAGVMASMMHAPLTAIFLIAELTSGYSLFMTLMVTSVTAYLTIIIFEPHSIYAMRLAQTGELLTHNKDKAVLTMLKMEHVIETDLSTVHPDDTLGDLVKVISQSSRNIYPVVDFGNVLVGVILLSEVRNVMFRPELYNRFRLRQLMISPPALLSPTDSMEKVMSIFESTQAWNLPVVEHGKYVGFVSKSKIFNAYRNLLLNFSDE